MRILNGHQCTSFHSIDVQRAVQMIDLVLKNARVPTLRVDSYFFTPFIQTFNTNIQRAIHDRLVAFDAKATFEKLC